MAKRPLTIAMDHLTVIIDDLLSVHIEAANPKQRRALLNDVLAPHVLDILLRSDRSTGWPPTSEASLKPSGTRHNATGFDAPAGQVLQHVEHCLHAASCM
jgi:hypothetical protein